jgi:hypothetical protein
MASLIDFHKKNSRLAFSPEDRLKQYELYLFTVMPKDWNEDRYYNLFSHWGPNAHKITKTKI